MNYRFYFSVLIVIGVMVPNTPPCNGEEAPHYKISSDTDDPGFRYHISTCQYWNEGKKREAMKDFKESLKLRPNDFDIWFDRAQANFDLARYGRAWKDLDQVAALEPSEGWKFVVRQWRGLILLRRGKTDRARAAFNDVIRH